MPEKKRHIPQLPDERYPEPGIRVDEAWEEMDSLLDIHLPVSSAVAKGGAGLAGKLAGVFIVLAAAVGAGYWWFDRPPESAEPPLTANGNSVALKAPDLRAFGFPDEMTGLKEIAAGAGNETSGSKGFFTPGVGSGIGKAQQGSARQEHVGPDAAGKKELMVAAAGEEEGKRSALPVVDLLSPPKPVAWKEPSEPLVARPVPGGHAPAGKRAGMDWGLEWRMNFPLRPGGDYFRDLGNTNGVLLGTIPSLWVSRPVDEKGNVVVNLRPYFDYFAGNGLLYEDKVLRDSILMDPNPDLVLKEIRLRKVRGSAVTIRYDRRLTDRLTAGAGLSGQVHWQALTAVRTGSSWTGITGAADLSVIGRSDTGWHYLRPYQVAGHFELSYRTGPWGWGTAFTVPMLSFSGQTGSFRSWNGSLVVRRRLN